MEQGLLVVLSGPAGSGKGTVRQTLLETPEFTLSVSATTRAPRPGEIDGKDYSFVSRERFLAMVEAGELLEYTEYCKNFYGTPKSEVTRALSAGVNLILEIEVEGAMNVKKQYPDAVLIMLLPPSYSEQEARLRNRGTETEEAIRNRLAKTKIELSYLKDYDYVVYNKGACAAHAAEQIREIVHAEKCAVRRDPDAKERYLAN